MRNLTSEFFLYFLKFHVHDGKNYFPLSLPSSKFLNPAITTNLIELIFEIIYENVFRNIPL